MQLHLLRLITFRHMSGVGFVKLGMGQQTACRLLVSLLSLRVHLLVLFQAMAYNITELSILSPTKHDNFFSQKTQTKALSTHDVYWGIQ